MRLIRYNFIQSDRGTFERYSAGTLHRECSAGRSFVRVYIFLTIAYRIVPPLINTSTSNQVLEKSGWQLTNMNTAGDTVLTKVLSGDG